MTTYQPTQTPTPKKKHPLLIGFLGLLAFGGIVSSCEDDTPPAPTVRVAPDATGGTFTPSVPRPAPAPVEPALDVDQVFLLSLAPSISGYDYSLSGTDSDLLFLAEQVCSFLNRGAGDSNDAGLVLVDNGFGSGMAGYFVGAAMAAYCPQFT